MQEMNTLEDYTQFDSISQSIMTELNDMTHDVVLASDRIDSLQLVVMDTTELKQYIDNIETVKNTVQKQFCQLMKICGNAFNSLQTMLKTQQEELTDKIFETSDETQNMLNDVLSKLSDLDHSINDIKSFNEPHGICMPKMSSSSMARLCWRFSWIQ